MTEDQQGQRRLQGSGPWGMLAAICVTATAAFMVAFEILVADMGGWPWLHHGIVGVLLGILAFACTVAAAVDCWLSLSGTRRRSPRSYLQTAGILLLIACFAGGLLVVPFLLPGLALTWAARQAQSASVSAVLTSESEQDGHA